MESPLCEKCVLICTCDKSAKKGSVTFTVGELSVFLIIVCIEIFGDKLYYV